MIKIAICEDNRVFAEKLLKEVREYFWSKEIENDISVFSTASDFSNMDLTLYNLFLLDIRLGEANGIDIGVKIRRENPDATIIYITEFYEYAAYGYSARPIAFILKGDNQFEKSLREALGEYIREKVAVKEAITFKNRSDEKTVFLQDILYIESFSRKLSIHFAKDDAFEIYGKISDMEDRLSDKGFLRIHKSYLVNISHIKKVLNYEVYLSSGEILPASKERYPHIMEVYALRRGKR